MIPSALAAQLEQGLGDFLRASFHSTTPGFEDLVARLLEEEGGITKGPYIQVQLPYIAGSKPAFFPKLPLDFVPHRHQELAFQRLSGDSGRSTLIATGTGSGKTECFLLPILDHCLAHVGEPGIKAILIYPMNALATDQAERIARLVNGNDHLRGAVRVGLYIGEDPDASPTPQQAMGPRSVITDRKTLQLDPPDVLLTNYKMLDRLLLRPRDQRIWRGSEGAALRFLVVDELHTFDGAQGTDLACLVRRLKDRLKVRPSQLCCIGTSATLGGPGTAEALREYAEQVFGEPFDRDAVITEARQDLDAFRGDTVLRFLPTPDAPDKAALDPSQYNDALVFVTTQARLWLGEGPPGEPGSDVWRVALGDRLREHVMLDNLLRKLRGRPRPLGDLVKELAATAPQLKDARLGERAIVSFLALISAARRWRHELDDVRARRETEGRSRPTEPFLQVRVQLWVREVRRMVASVGAQPHLRFSDDLTEAQRRGHLPVIHCRECGAMGWATLIERYRPHVLRVDLQEFYRAYFAHDARVHYVFPASADVVGANKIVDPDELVVLRDPEDGPKNGVPVKLVRKTDDRGQRPRLSHDCPFCDSPESLALLGFQAATLTSVFIDQLFASRFNEDKKLLAFSDSVQDASHRAGFFGARTWRFNLRVALQRAITDRADGATLAELPERFTAYWQAPGRMDPVNFVSTFLAPNMVWFREWEAVRDKGEVPEGSSLINDIQRRVAWEIAVEYGLQARIGRSLSRTGCSVADVDEGLLETSADRLLEPLRNEVGGLRSTDAAAVRVFLAGFLTHLRERGAILSSELPKLYIENAGSTFAFKFANHLPDYGPGSRMPALLTQGRVSERFDALVGTASRPTWYERWFRSVLAPNDSLVGEPIEAYNLALPVLEQVGILERRQTKKGQDVWGLRPEALRVSTKVTRVVCATCRHTLVVAASQASLWQDAPCASARCRGRTAAEPALADDYFGRLYRSGDVHRIFAEEHSSLLGRKRREEIEAQFKARSDARPWFPNVLSCTPTLEMGIDIGDLSSAILCSVPPAQANYLQRIGRAGRRDGNALVLTVANARGHDLYFYAAPEEMLAGDIHPPGIYLGASAVIERQLTAFCFDRWAAQGAEGDLPDQMKQVFSALDSENETRFPYNFQRFVDANQRGLLQDFLALFGEAIPLGTREHLAAFMVGRDGGTLVHRILEEIFERQRERDRYRADAQRAAEQYRQKRAQPVQDEATQNELDELDQERDALRALVNELDRRDTLNFFTDEGLLPNYAFPEAPVRLRSVIFRKRQKVEDGGSQYETWTYEYERPGAAAIAELAPENTFYAGGRRVRIDQVQVASEDIEDWRFCDACHYHQRDVLVGDHPRCPACGSALWRDSGRVLKLVRLRQVFANTSDRQSRLSDDRDDREPRFYLRQMLVTFKNDDRGQAWKLSSPDLPFAFEFLRRASFREMNFGAYGKNGQEIDIAGERATRTGFVICRHCGKVQPGHGEAKHVVYCAARKKDAPTNFAECVYLYREFSSEALRLLLPITDIGSDVQRQSLTAALHLGLKEKFRGKVDHLRATFMSDPVAGSPQRKHFLVLFDSVPGGTGYLKDLAGDPQQLFEVLELAHNRLRDCRCATEAGRDGCYRCIYAYGLSRELASTSRTTALGLLARILDRRQTLAKIPSLSEVSVTGLLDSELEARFIEALRRLDTLDRPSSITKALVNGKPGYRWTIGTATWNVELQRRLDGPSGVGVSVSIDFVFHPGAGHPHGTKPVAVFLDGWVFHRNRVGRDMRQRMALLASGRYDVWSFTWSDVDNVGKAEVSDGFDVFFRDRERFEEKACRSVNGGKALLEGRLSKLLDLPSLSWFAAAMSGEVAGSDWRKLGFLVLFSQLDLMRAEQAGEYKKRVGEWVPGLAVQMFDATLGDDFVYLWPCDDDERLISIVATGTPEALKTDLAKLAVGGPFSGLRIGVRLHDRGEVVDDKRLRRSWNAYLRLLLLVRDIPQIWFTADGDPPDLDYTPLLALRSMATGSGGDAWSLIRREVDSSFTELVSTLAVAGVPAPEVGLDLPDAQNGSCGTVAELAWPNQRLAVASRIEMERAESAIAPGWTVFALEDLSSGAQPLLDALAAGGKE